MDGSTVVVGDSMFDIVLNEMGVVTAVDAVGGFTLKFPTTSVTYYASGSTGTFKRAYWSNPVVFIPSKNDQRMHVFRQTAALLASLPSV